MGAGGALSLGLPVTTTTTSPQAREMTLQAMALQQQPLGPTPRPLPPEVSLACPAERRAALGLFCSSLGQLPRSPSWA